jgi:hypothetical protein
VNLFPHTHQVKPSEMSPRSELATFRPAHKPKLTIIWVTKLIDDRLCLVAHWTKQDPKASKPSCLRLFRLTVFLTILPIFSLLPEERSRCWPVSKMVRLIGTGLLGLGVVVILINPMLIHIWVVAIALGLLSHWVTQN